MIKRLLASSFFRSLEIFVQIAATLLVTPYMINVLGDHDYGLWILILSLVGWFNVLDLGFSSAVQREINIALAEGNETRINLVFSCAVVLFFVLGLIASSGVVLLSYASANFSLFGIDRDSQGILSISLLILSVKVLWDFTMYSIHGFFSALLRFDIDSNITSLGIILKYSLIVYLILDYRVYGAVIATMFSDIFINGIKLVYAKKIYGPLKFTRSDFSFKEIKSLFDYSKHVILFGLSNTLNTKVAPVLIARLFDLPSLTLYSVGNRLSRYFDLLTRATVDIFQPVFTNLHARNRNMEAMFIDVASINIFISTLLLFPLYVLSEQFIALWVGEGLVYAGTIVRVEIFSLLCHAVAMPIRNILLAQANHRLLSLVSIIGALISITLSILFSMQIGLIGVPLGAAIGFLVSDVFLCLLLLRRYNTYRIWDIVFRFLVSIVIIYGGGSLVIRLLSETEITWLNLFFESVIIGVASVLITVPCLLNKRVRGKLMVVIRQKSS